MASSTSFTFTSASDFYKKIFGVKTYKISLDSACTCPNRDGSLSTGGCIFCSAGGSGEFSSSAILPIKMQVKKAIELIEKKAYGRRGKENINNEKKPVFIAYFQNFTSTYGDQEVLQKKYIEALSCPQVKGLALATRPDCLSDSMIDFLRALSKKFFVQIEFGLQTSNNLTAKKINRCYKSSVYTKIMKKLHNKAPDIHVVSHIIFGLPGETEKDMINSVKFALKNGTSGIKFTILYVLKNTPLEKLYTAGNFKCLEMEEYFELLVKALKIIPRNIVIHRLTGDGPKKLLIAPEWTKNKRNVLNKLNSYLKLKLQNN